MTYSEAFPLWVAEVYRNHGYEPDKWYGSEVAQALYVDDYYEALNEAAKEGFTVMTVQELMLRQYTAEQ